MPPQLPGRATGAIGLVLAAMAAFAIMDGLTKLVSQTLPIAQIMWVRNIIFTAVALALIRRQVGQKPLMALARSARPGLQFIRALVLVIESAMFMLAFKFLPLADVHALAAAAPLLVVALSVPVLGEKVGPRRWAAVLIGFVGVLLIIRPGTTTIQPASLIALAGAALWAVYQILVRLCSRVDRTETTTLWTAAVALGATSVIGPLNWVWPDATAWALLIAIAGLGSFAHVAFIQALGLVGPAVLQPFTYTLFVWAVAVGYGVFGDFPDLWTLSGAAIIIASGIYVWHRERVRAGETT
jgi:drug/metabolite transporter (DMT)-like permease